MTVMDAGGDRLDELALVLARYADSVLRPDPGAMDRIRRELRAEAQRAWVRRRAERLAIAAVPAVVPTVAPRPLGRRTVRKVVLALAAALLLGSIVGSAVFAASRAGGPLYELRVALEAVTLPNDPEDRLAAELLRASERLAEAAEAAARGDAAGVLAALTAYQRIMDETAGITADPAAVQRAVDQIAHHQALLEKLLGQVPEQAHDDIIKAQDKSDNAVKDLRTAPPAQGTDPTPGPKKTPAPDRTPRNDGNPGGGNPGSGNPGGGNQGGGGQGSGGQGPPAPGGEDPPGQGAGGSGGTSGQGGADRTPRPARTGG